MADINEQLNEIIGRLGGEADNLYTSKLNKIISLLEGGSGSGGSGGSYRVEFHEDLSDGSFRSNHTPAEIFEAVNEGLIPYAVVAGFIACSFVACGSESAFFFGLASDLDGFSFGMYMVNEWSTVMYIPFNI